MRKGWIPLLMSSSRAPRRVAPLNESLSSNRTSSVFTLRPRISPAFAPRECVCVVVKIIRSFMSTSGWFVWYRERAATTAVRTESEAVVLENFQVVRKILIIVRHCTYLNDSATDTRRICEDTVQSKEVCCPIHDDGLELCTCRAS